MNRDKLISDLVRDEGLRTDIYVDTVGKLTIGCGRNLTDNGILKQEAMLMLGNDIDNVEAELDHRVPWWRGMPVDAQLALANMCFNLGWPRLSKFKNMLRHLEDGLYDSAADEALDSKWSKQVGDRARRVSELIRNS